MQPEEEEQFSLGMSSFGNTTIPDKKIIPPKPERQSGQLSVVPIMSKPFAPFNRFMFTLTKASNLYDCSRQSLFLKLRITPKLDPILPPGAWCNGTEADFNCAYSIDFTNEPNFQFSDFTPAIELYARFSNKGRLVGIAFLPLRLYERTQIAGKPITFLYKDESVAFKDLTTDCTVGTIKATIALGWPEHEHFLDPNSPDFFVNSSINSLPNQKNNQNKNNNNDQSDQDNNKNKKPQKQESKNNGKNQNNSRSKRKYQEYSDYSDYDYSDYDYSEQEVPIRDPTAFNMKCIEIAKSKGWFPPDSDGNWQILARKNKWVPPNAEPLTSDEVIEEKPILLDYGIQTDDTEEKIQKVLDDVGIPRTKPIKQAQNPDRPTKQNAHSSKIPVSNSILSTKDKKKKIQSNKTTNNPDDKENTKKTKGSSKTNVYPIKDKSSTGSFDNSNQSEDSDQEISQALSSAFEDVKNSSLYQSIIHDNSSQSESKQKKSKNKQKVPVPPSPNVETDTIKPIAIKEDDEQLDDSDSHSDLNDNLNLTKTPKIVNNSTFSKSKRSSHTNTTNSSSEILSSGSPQKKSLNPQYSISSSSSGIKRSTISNNKTKQNISKSSKTQKSTISSSKIQNNEIINDDNSKDKSQISNDSNISNTKNSYSSSGLKNSNISNSNYSSSELSSSKNIKTNSLSTKSSKNKANNTNSLSTKSNKNQVKIDDQQKVYNQQFTMPSNDTFQITNPHFENFQETSNTIPKKDKSSTINKKSNYSQSSSNSSVSFSDKTQSHLKKSINQTGSLNKSHPKNEKSKLSSQSSLDSNDNNKSISTLNTNLSQKVKGKESTKDKTSTKTIDPLLDSNIEESLLSGKDKSKDYSSTSSLKTKKKKGTVSNLMNDPIVNLNSSLSSSSHKSQKTNSSEKPQTNEQDISLNDDIQDSDKEIPKSQNSKESNGFDSDSDLDISNLSNSLSINSPEHTNKTDKKDVPPNQKETNTIDTLDTIDTNETDITIPEKNNPKLTKPEPKDMTISEISNFPLDINSFDEDTFDEEESINDMKYFTNILENNTFKSSSENEQKSTNNVLSIEEPNETKDTVTTQDSTNSKKKNRSGNGATMSTSSSGNESTQPHSNEINQNNESNKPSIQKENSDEFSITNQELDTLINSNINQGPIMLASSPDFKLKEKIPTNPSLSVSDDELLDFPNLNVNSKNDESASDNESESFF